MKVSLLCGGLLAALLFSSCSVNTPATRIEKNPQIYEGLDGRDRELVQTGRIREGMDHQAVYLAWGNPDGRSEGQESGRTYERWTYTGMRPIYHQSFYGGYGWGRYGRYGRGRYHHPWSGFGTEISYVPYRAAWVKFENGRVSSWQRGRVPL